VANSVPVVLNDQTIGRISVEGAKVRGEGGPINPQLVVPLEVQLYNQPDETMLAVGRLRVLLGTDEAVQPATAICPPVCADLIGTNPAFAVTSRPTSQVTNQVELRFFLTSAQVEELEHRRHASRGDVFNLHLRLEPTIIGLKNFNRQSPGSMLVREIWDTKYGEYAELAVFWKAKKSEALRVGAETSTWVQNVLPGLGYDRVRLVEVTLPPTLPGQPNAAAQFDKAKDALDARRYDDCVSACRGLLAMWKNVFGATNTNPVASMIADRLGWSADDGRCNFLDALWKAATDFVNVTHHPEAAGQATGINYRDARLTMFLTVALSEYVGSVTP